MGTFMVHCHPSSLCLQEFLVNCLRLAPKPLLQLYDVLSSSVHIHAICIIYMHYLPQLTYTTHAIYYIVCIMQIMHISSAIYISIMHILSAIYADIYYIICMHILQIICIICLRLHTIRRTRRYAATSPAQFNYTAKMRHTKD